jgi:hypothetical protein
MTAASSLMFLGGVIAGLLAAVILGAAVIAWLRDTAP